MTVHPSQRDYMTGPELAKVKKYRHGVLTSFRVKTCEQCGKVEIYHSFRYCSKQCSDVAKGAASEEGESE